MEVQIGDKIRNVTLISKDGNKVSVDIDGEVYNVDAAMLQNGTCSLIHNGKSYNAEMTKNSEGRHYTVNVNYSTYQIDILDSQAKYMRMRKRHSNAVQSDTVKVPMPCRIVKVYVKPGDKVAAGDTLFTMEAMKMQSNYKVSADCTIKEVMAKDGDTVGADTVIMKLSI